MDDALVPYLAGLLAVITSLISSFAGGGSSLLLISALILLSPDLSYIELLTITKVGTSLNSAASGNLHFARQNLNLKILGSLIFAGLLGMIFGTYLVQFKLNDVFLKTFIPIILLGTGLFLLIAKNQGLNDERQLPATRKRLFHTGLVRFFISAMNAIAGGLGVLLNSYLVFQYRISFIKAAAYVAISGLIIVVLQTSYLLWNIPVDLKYMAFVAFGALLGGIMGTKLQYIKGSRWVRAASIILMFAIGFILLVF